MTAPLKIYVASSWRNTRQPVVVQALRQAGHEVYDFKNPPERSGFGWEQLGGGDLRGEPTKYLEALQHPLAKAGFRSDMEALAGCDACVLVLPCGRSAHLELGFAAGEGKKTLVLLDHRIDEPELMYLMCSGICRSLEQLLDALAPQCPSCRGEGKVADTEDREPWSAWARLPPGSDIAVRLGVVKPIPCDACSGRGFRR